MERNEMGIDLIELFNKGLRMVIGTWKIILPVLIAATAVSAVYVRLTYEPVYESKTSFAVSKELNGETTYQYNTNAADDLSTSFQSLLYSDVMVDALCADIGTEVLPAEISSARIGTTNLFTVYVRGRNPDDVSNVIQAFLNNYAKVFKASLMDINLEIIENPEEPYVGNAPQYLKYIGYTDGVILLIYLLLITLIAFFRRTIVEEEDIKQWLRSTCLGTLPYIRTVADEGGALITEDGSRYSEMKEGIGSIRRRIEREKDKTGHKTYIVTAAADREGTSTVAANLALSLAYRGYMTVLVDMNLYMPSQKKNFRLSEENGGASIDIEDIRYIPHKAGESANLDIFAVNRPSQNSSAVLNSKSFQRIIPVLANNYDYVIIDTPPVLKHTDTLVISKLADSFIFVIKEDKTSIRDLVEAMERLGESDAHVSGCILNGSKTHVSRYGYGYGYGYGYKYGYGYGYGYGYKRYSRGYGKGKKQKAVKPADGE